MIVGVGKAGNPDVMDGVDPKLIVGSSTEAIAGEHLIVTAGALDVHCHFICPQQVTEAFAAGTGHSKSGVHSSSRALVKHHFHASDWTSKHPRHKHPIYGEVERCNWNIECVDLWDANTAFFDSLPEKEQMEMISIKYADAHTLEFGRKVNAPQMPFKA